MKEYIKIQAKEGTNDKDTKKQEIVSKDEEIEDFGQTTLNHKIHLITVIGEIEGHECLPSNTKTTKSLLIRRSRCA